MAQEEPEELTFWQRRKVPIVIGALVLAGAAGYFVFGPKGEPKRKSAPVNMVAIMPPLPPPPPPPTPPPTPPPEVPPEPQETKAPEFVEETQPDSPPEPAKDAPPEEAAPMGSDIQGDGPPDGFGLAGRGGGGLIGGKGTGNQQGGTKWGWYAGKVQSRVAEALRSHRRTRSASLSVKVRVWADSTGRITQVKLAGSTGDAALDRAITAEALNGLQLDEPPPADMPMPIVMRLSAKRPN